MASESPYEVVGRLFGRERIRMLGGYVDASGLNITPEAAAGFYLVLGLVLSFLSSLTLMAFSPTRAAIYKFSLWVFHPLVLNFPQFVYLFSALLSLAIVFSVFGLFGYVALLLLADARRNKFEQSLPDFLTLAAANVRAGMTIDQAMWYAAKPEFGLLSTEVEFVAKQTFGGVPFPQALDGLAKRVDSRNVRRMVSLIKQGLASGGEIAEILEQTADDTRNMQILKRDISASLLMYIIFIVFAAGIGTPFLYAVSSKLITILEGVFAQLPYTSQLAASGPTFIKFSPPIVSSYQFFIFVLASSALTAIFSSMMIGVIQRGAKREGVKYIPFIAFASISIFFLVSFVLDNFLRGMGAF